MLQIEYKIENFQFQSNETIEQIKQAIQFWNRQIQNPTAKTKFATNVSEMSVAQLKDHLLELIACDVDILCGNYFSNGTGGSHVWIAHNEKRIMMIWVQEIAESTELQSGANKMTQIKYYNHIINKSDKTVSGPIISGSYKSINQVKDQIKTAIEDLIKANDDYYGCCYTEINGKFFKYQNNGQFVTPKNRMLGRAGYTTSSEYIGDLIDFMNEITQ